MKHRTIYADPPWNETGGGQIKRGADRHYPLMKTPQILEYMSKVQVDENAHLYLWVTNNYLKDGLYVMEKLGFRYVTNLVWVKDKFGLGQYFRGQHELLLFGVKGKLPYKSRAGSDRTTVIKEPRTIHSKKPTILYSIIEETSYPPYIELFARNRRAGWASMGNELDRPEGEWF